MKPESNIMTKSETPFGRYMLHREAANPTEFSFFIESVENEGKDSFWLPIRGANGHFIAYLKFFACEPFERWPGSLCFTTQPPQTIFLLSEVRPVGCPIQGLEDECKRFLNHPQEEI